MAQQTNSKLVRGMIGNVIFQGHSGKQIIRSRSTNMKQTAATISSASEFGNCSRWSKALRIGLRPFLAEWADTGFYRRFTAALYNVLTANTAVPKGERSLYNTNLDGVSGLNCNLNTPWDKWFLAELTVTPTPDKQLHFTVPELVTAVQVQYPEGCQQAELVLYVMATTTEPGAPITAYHTTVPLPFGTPLLPATDWLTPALPEGTIGIAAAQLLFYDHNAITGRRYYNSGVLNPAVVILLKALG
jgi:hypothetical protein